MNVIEIILWVLLAVTIIAAICNWIGMLRLKRSKPIYLDELINPIRPIVTIYTYEDGTKVYENCDGSVEVEPPTDDNKGDEV